MALPAYFAVTVDLQGANPDLSVEFEPEFGGPGGSLTVKCTEDIRAIVAAVFMDAARDLMSQSLDSRAVYSAYLGSAEWRERRAAALETAGQACQVCSSTQRLEVHHRTYIRIGQEAPADLIVLCDACHDLFHSHRRLAS